MAKVSRSISPLKRAIGLLLVLAGVGLFLLALSGRNLDLRNLEIYELNKGTPFGVTLSYGEFLKRLPRREREGDENYAIRLNGLVNQAMAHYWDRPDTEKFNIVLPAKENWLIWLDQLDETDSRYEFKDPYKAVERGVGFCSQESLALYGFLKLAGIKAQEIKLSGHVVVRAMVAPEKWLVLDPDYGVVIPRDMSEIEKNPEIISPFYRRAGFGQDEINRLKDVYGPDKNEVWDFDIATRWRDWFFNHDARKYVEEKRRYFLIWAIPAFLVALGLLMQTGMFWRAAAKGGKSLFKWRRNTKNQRKRNAKI